MTTIYLAGKIHGLDYEEATGWRNKIKAEAPKEYVFLDPMDGKEFLRDVPTIPIQTEMSNNQIFHTDIHSVRKAGMIIANLNHLPMVRTWFELGFAYDTTTMLVYICSPDNPYRNHPFVTESADIIFDTVEDVIRWLKIR